ncbi:putative inactive shikimate kinase like 1 chloroplastic [Bienertia sinuspersici]
MKGMKNAMKSSMGKLMADVLRYYYFDSDSVVEEAAGEDSSGKSFRERDVDGFRESEVVYIQRLVDAYVLVLNRRQEERMKNNQGKNGNRGKANTKKWLKHMPRCAFPAPRQLEALDLRLCACLAPMGALFTTKTEVLKQLSSLGRLVVNAGNGAVQSITNLALLRHGISIWIDVPLDMIAKEFKRDAEQSTVSNISTSDSVSEELDQLTLLYEEHLDGYATADAMISLQAVASKLGYDEFEQVTAEDMALEVVKSPNSYMFYSETYPPMSLSPVYTNYNAMKLPFLTIHHHHNLTSLSPPSPSPSPLPSLSIPSRTQPMVFHTAFYWGKAHQILFLGWPGSSTGMYVLALLLVFSLAVLVECLSYVQLVKPGSNRVGYCFFRTGMRAVRAGVAYMVILAVMSYNVGIFIAAIVGHAFGYLLFGSGLCLKPDRPSSSLVIGFGLGKM